MVVCVLKHTPGVFVDYTNENDTVYSGLEVEVFTREIKLNTRFVYESFANFSCIN